ncbi:MAG: class I SAM-dependent methyltransferase [Ignavibacteria bacterium]|nr:class I SAM-dependent methyltransferase [Bacteroidota bacterium]MBL7128893.1 class I SAM-dependent methyltransferase [Ignavibacteria bacterium]
MFKRLITYYKTQQFIPGFLSIFINPFYFSRKGIYKGIRENSRFINGVLLDFGCGSKPYKHLFNIDEYIGVDIQNRGHDHSYEDIDVFYNGYELPFSDSFFNSIFSSEVFEHVFNLEEIISELHRVLKKGGKMLITVPFSWDEHEIPSDFCRYTSFGIKDMMEKSGFEILCFSKSSNYLEAIFQMWILYLYRVLNTGHKYLNVILNIIFVSPFTVAGIICSKLFPCRYDYYLNNIVLMKKL